MQMLATVWCKRSIVATAFITRDVHLNIRVTNCWDTYEAIEGKLNVSIYYSKKYNRQNCDCVNFVIGIWTRPSGLLVGHHDRNGDTK